MNLLGEIGERASRGATDGRSGLNNASARTGDTPLANDDLACLHIADGKVTRTRAVVVETRLANTCTQVDGTSTNLEIEVGHLHGFYHLIGIEVVEFERCLVRGSGETSITIATVAVETSKYIVDITISIVEIVILVQHVAVLFRKDIITDGQVVAPSHCRQRPSHHHHKKK